MRPIAWWDCPTCISTVDAWFAAYLALDPIGRVETLLLTALSVGVLMVVVARWQRATGTARQRLAPVVLAGAVLAGGFVVTFLLQTIVPTSAREPLGELRVIVLAVLRVLVAIGLLIGVLRDDSARGRIADLVVRLDGLPPLPVLQASLRDALGDPSLKVFRWEPAFAGFADAAGRPSDRPGADGSGRTVLTIGDGASPDLVIEHDPSLRDDPGLVSAAAAAVRLAAENERLQAEVRSQLESVRASRARIVEAQDDERRRIERDLHDGAQQRLVSLQLSLQMLRRGLGPDADAGTLAELDAATAEASAAIADIRELARGVHPAILSEAGLGAALASLADRTPIPVVIEDGVDRRLPAGRRSHRLLRRRGGPDERDQTCRRGSDRGQDVADRRSPSGRGPRRRTRRRRSHAGDRHDRHAGSRRCPWGHPPDRQPPRRGDMARGGSPMRVAVAEDVVLLREGIVRVLRDGGFEVVGAVGDAAALLELVERERVDVAIVDIRMPPTHTDEGLVAAEDLLAREPSVPVVVLSQNVEPAHAVRLLGDGRGGVGYLLKERVAAVDDLLDAVDRVGRGGTAVDPAVVAALVGRRRARNPLDDLTPREREVLELMAEGRSNRAIASRLVVGDKTVETHVASILSKLGLEEAPDDHRRVLAVLSWLRRA